MGEKKPGISTTIQAERRRLLVDATISAISEHGLPKLTLAKIADIAGLSAGSVNFHFASKEALLLETLTELALEFEQRILLALDNAGKALLLLAAGEPGDVRIDGEGEHRLLRLDAAGTPVGSASPLVRLEGFTLERGADPLRGGGILAEGVSLELVDCTVENCQTLKDVGAGGAIWCDRDLRLERCSFLENRSGGDGASGQTFGMSLI